MTSLSTLIIKKCFYHFIEFLILFQTFKTSLWINVKIKEKYYKAKVIGFDYLFDIALLKIDPKEKLKPIYIGNSANIKIGNWAIALGSSFGTTNTFSLGVICKKFNKKFNYNFIKGPLLITDASIHPGNSGGPLINLKGEVIGMCRMIYPMNKKTYGIGFVIPISFVKYKITEFYNKYNSKNINTK